MSMFNNKFYLVIINWNKPTSKLIQKLITNKIQAIKKITNKILKLKLILQQRTSGNNLIICMHSKRLNLIIVLMMEFRGNQTKIIFQQELKIQLRKLRRENQIIPQVQVRDKPNMKNYNNNQVQSQKQSKIIAKITKLGMDKG